MGSVRRPENTSKTARAPGGPGGETRSSVSVITDSIETVAGDAPLAGMADGVGHVQHFMLAVLADRQALGMSSLLEMAQKDWSNSITAMAFWGLVSHHKIELDDDLVVRPL